MKFFILIGLMTFSFSLLADSKIISVPAGVSYIEILSEKREISCRQENIRGPVHNLPVMQDELGNYLAKFEISVPNLEDFLKELAEDFDPNREACQSTSTVTFRAAFIHSQRDAGTIKIELAFDDVRTISITKIH